MTGWTRVTIALTWLSSGALAQASSLPPLGKRVYIIESKSVFTPVVIESDHSSKAKEIGGLKDPLPLAHTSGKDKRKSTVKAAKDEKNKALLSFKTVAIKGRHAAPRVSFTLEPQKTQQAFLPLNLDLEDRLLKQLHKQQQRARSLEP